MEQGRARVVPDRDHRRGVAPGRRRDRQAARRRHPRPGRRQGHRRLDRADRALARRSRIRHRRGDLRPVAVVASRAARRGRILPGPDEAFEVADVDAFIEDVRLALFASKIIAYSQGFDEIRAGAAEYDWTIDLSAVSKIWRAGCIIRAQFLNRIADAYVDAPDLPVLATAPYFAAALTDGQAAWRRVVVAAETRAEPRRPSARRSRTTTACAPTACRRPWCRVSATSSARTRTSASTRKAPSTRCGRATAIRTSTRSVTYC